MRYKYWIEEEVKFLRENYKTATEEELKAYFGEHYSSVRQKASSMGLKRKHYITVDKDVLYGLYINQGLSTAQISSKLRCSSSSIKKYLHKYGIPVREPGESPKLLFLTRELLQDLYIDKQLSLTEIASIYRVDSVSVFRYLNKYGILLRDKSEAASISNNKPEYLSKCSKISKARWQNSEYQKKVSDGIKKANINNPELRELRSQQSKKNWQDPEYVFRVLSKLNQCPNKKELMLDGILKKHFPDFKYNGDCRLGVILAGMIPDFVNTNGKKQVIEMFGKHWHEMHDTRNRTEGGRIVGYNSVGFRCLVIWDYELKKTNENKVISKILSFTEGGK